jgi:phytoene/squalene synthetase
VERDARPTLRTMTSIYRGILDRILRDPGAVLKRRVGLSSMRKLSLVLGQTWRQRFGGAK